MGGNQITSGKSCSSESSNDLIGSHGEPPRIIWESTTAFSASKTHNFLDDPPQLLFIVSTFFQSQQTAISELVVDLKQISLPVQLLDNFTQATTHSSLQRFVEQLVCFVEFFEDGCVARSLVGVKPINSTICIIPPFIRDPQTVHITVFRISPDSKTSKRFKHLQ